ncbi:MAG: bifunctional 23S rRNA (guanine(2069)-N(7))-methyltransferase RlmK/23S rRNA (guanine(2445)-N(2))-methyltransferase RlmL [Lacipirellulaceae bacterium]
MPPLELIATASFGLETVVRHELEALGYEARVVTPGRVLFLGDESAIAQANLWLRTAERVLVRVAHAPATDFGLLFDLARAAPWGDWIAPGGQFPVSGKSHKSQLASVPACQRIVKKALVEHLREAHGHGAEGDVPETGPEFPVEVMLLNDEATLCLDTTGVGLHKRGYRRYVGEAPLRETLAAAMVLLSRWRAERPFWDPFCGTGTLPIEAALIGRDIAPGARRNFLCEAWPRMRAANWPGVRASAARRAKPDLEERLLATDSNEEALRLARLHAEAAGVEGDIHFQRREFAELSSSRPYGCLVTNPPYGERIGDRDEVGALYRSMPGVLRRLTTWSHFVLTAWPDFEQLVGQPASKRRKLYNGRIECTYYQFHGPKWLSPEKRRAAASGPDAEATGQQTDASGQQAEASGQQAEGSWQQADARGQAETGSEGREPIAESPSLTTERRQPKAPSKAPPKPAFGGLRPEAERQAREFGNRLRARARHLRKWPARGITCYRLYDRDVPDVPLAVDRYGDAAHVAEYERPHERTVAEHADWLDLMIGVVAEVLETPRELVFLKRRERQRGDAQYERFSDAGAERIVTEGGLRFRVNLSDYLDTGLFLDHRVTRGMVRDAANGKRFLNLFGYTGAFTVYAAAGGASETTTIDLSATYLYAAEENLRRNDLAGPQHRFVRGDGRAYVHALPKGELLDLVVLDPPTFSNSKRLDEDWDVQRDAVPLLNALAERLAPGGRVYFSTNFRRFKFDESALHGLAAREISRQTVPEDFRNERIHRCWLLRKE